MTFPLEKTWKPYRLRANKEGPAHVLSMRITEAQEEFLARESKRQGVSRAVIIRDLINIARSRPYAEA